MHARRPISYTTTTMIRVISSSLRVLVLFFFVLIVSLFSVLNVRSFIHVLNTSSCECLSVLAHLRYKSELSWFVSAHHCVALACARLTVSEHTDIVTFERVLQHLQPNVLIDTPLTRKLRVTRLITNRTNYQLTTSYQISMISPALYTVITPVWATYMQSSR